MKIDTKYPNIFIDLNESTLRYKVVQILESGKLKIRRLGIGRARKKAIKGRPKCDNYGNRLYDPFLSIDDAKQHALSFVDNHLIVDRFK